VSEKEKTERPGKPPLTCLYAASLGTLMDGLLRPTARPEKLWVLLVFVCLSTDT